ncbi:glycosyltransferase family 87 protein [Candidatus Leptofilum sp.]|uniref:glycosyltransferase family 87 protein n=1 Tax=Candidatus Leptofilum sp. TaxID=3241576 RepID=UPI003B593FCB
MATLEAPKNKSQQKGLVILFIIVVFGLLTWGMYEMLTGPARYNNRDFMSLFAGGKAILRGLDPYDPAVWNPLRAELGSTWMPDDRAPFPLWTLMLVLPFAALDLGWAAAAWLAFSLCVLGGGMFLLINAYYSKPLPVAEFALVALFTFTYRAVLVSMNNGQITFLLFFLLALFLWLVRRERPFLAGIILAFVIIKPNPFVLFVPAFGLWLLWRRRWQIIAGAATGGLAMFAISWLVLPGWLSEWLNVTGKTEVTAITPTVWGLAYEILPEWGAVLGLIFVAVVTAVLGLIIFRNQRLTETEVMPLALIASILTTPYAWVYEHLLLLIPCTLIYLAIKQRGIAALVWLLTVFILPWGTFWLAENRASDTFTVLVPLFVAAIFIYYSLSESPVGHDTIT